jgi:hypothetical protein
MYPFGQLHQEITDGIQSDAATLGEYYEWFVNLFRGFAF